MRLVAGGGRAERRGQRLRQLGGLRRLGHRSIVPSPPLHRPGQGRSASSPGRQLRGCYETVPHSRPVWRQELMKLPSAAWFQALKKSAWYVYADPEARVSPVLPNVL